MEAQQIEPNYRKALTYLAIKQRRRALVVIFTDLEQWRKHGLVGGAGLFAGAFESAAGGDDQRPGRSCRGESTAA